MYQSVRMMLELCQRKCPLAVDVLLPDGDAAVCRELGLSLSEEHGNSQKKPPNREWCVKHAKAYALLGRRMQDPSPIPSTATSRWFESLTEAQKSTLLYWQHKTVCSTPAGCPDDEAPGPASKFMTDIFHPHLGKERVSVHYEGVGEISPCIMPQQLVWLNFRDREPRLMLGKESMILQGWPIESVDLPLWADTRFLQDLAGCGTALPVLLALVMSTLSALTFTNENFVPDHDLAEDSHVQEALELLASMTSSAPDCMCEEQKLPTATGTTPKADAAPNEDMSISPAVGGEKRRRLSDGAA